MTKKETAIEMKGISKSFGGVKAIKSTNLIVEKGTIHALVGENGAGKSTLMKILCGLITKDSGKITILGKETEIESYVHSQELGIAIVPQELSLVESFTVAENIFLGREPVSKCGIVDKKKLFADTEELLKKLNIDLDAKAIIRDLSVSNKQMVVIAKVLSLDAEIIIMDEPTARLGEQEIKGFLEYMKYLREKGITIIYISHKLEEVFEISDKITVLRDGSMIGTHNASDITEDQLIMEMVNRTSESLNIHKTKKEFKEEVLRAEHLSCDRIVVDASFSLFKGEILGFYGIVGSGRTEMIRALLGIDKLKGGKVFLNGKEVFFKNICQSTEAGLVLVPEERRQQGLVMNFTIRENSTLGKLKNYSRLGIINGKKEAKVVNNLVDKLQVNCRNIEQKAGNLSGGNQQKVVISKFIDMPVDIFIFDEPTRGIDVGAKSEIYSLIEEISASGKSIIIISSEIPELQSICDRVAVMREGRVVKILNDEEFEDAENILKYSIGGRENDYER